MVGDWVQLKTYGVSDKFERTEAYIFVKVAEIGSGLITVEYNNDIKEPYRICENTEIEPIPLTKDILEKNGWELRVSPEGEDMLVLNLETIKLWWFVKDKELVLIGGSHLKIEYIHQLQHALGLCGIDPKITL